MTRSNAKCLKSLTVVELLLVFDELPVIVHVDVFLALLLLHNIYIMCAFRFQVTYNSLSHTPIFVAERGKIMVNWC